MGTNPLEGNYQLPGWSELKDPNDPYSITKKEDVRNKTTATTF